jgi:alpha,alpha-trehalase
MGQRDSHEATRMVPFPTNRLDAVIFDMDGVVSDTARVHQRCWKVVFDDYLRDRSARTGEALRLFDDEDYVRYVDGKPRYDGVESFLSSRRISLIRGAPSDPPGHDTICALGNLKDREFERAVAEEGVTLFDSTISFLRTLRAHGISTALISSSRHARVILEVANIADLFDTIVDGIDAETLELPGKPDPAIFVAAAQRLHVAPARAAVVEDALAGVEAAHRGGFGMVIGIGRSPHADELLDHGAGVVVKDLSELELQSGVARDPL